MKDLIEKINVVYIAIVVFIGVSLIASVFLGEKEIAMAATTGLLGFLGGPVAASTGKVQ